MGVLQLVVLVLELCILHGSAGLTLNSSVISPSVPQTIELPGSSTPPSPPKVAPTDKSVPLPSMPLSPSPSIVAPTDNFPPLTQAVPKPLPPTPQPVSHEKTPGAHSPTTVPQVQAPVALPPTMIPIIPLPGHSSPPTVAPTVSDYVSPMSAPPPSTGRKKNGVPVVSPPYKAADAPETVEVLVPSVPLSPLMIAPIDTSVQVPLMPINPPVISPTIKSAPLTQVPEVVPPTQQTMSPKKAPGIAPLIPVPLPQVPIVSPPINLLPERSLPVHPPELGVTPTVSESVSPISVTPPSISRKDHGIPVAAPPKETPNPWSPPPIQEHSASPSASPPTKGLEKPVAVHPSTPAVAPSRLPEHASSPTSPPPPTSSMKGKELPFAAPPQKTFHHLAPVNHPPIKEHDVSPISNPPPSTSKKEYAIPIASPPKETFHQLSPKSHSKTEGDAMSPKSAPHPRISTKDYTMPVAAPPKQTYDKLSPTADSPTKGPYPIVSSSSPKSNSPFSIVPTPSISPTKHLQKIRAPSPASLPSTSFFKHHHARKRVITPALTPSYSDVPPTSNHQGPTSPGALQPPTSPVKRPVTPLAPSHSPRVPPKKSRLRIHSPPPLIPGFISPTQPPFSSTVTWESPAPSPSATISSTQTKRPNQLSPLPSSPRTPKMTPPPPVQVLPPPPPNQDCASITCLGQYTNNPPGAPCGCVIPIKVELRLGVALYTFFPLVSELAVEIASGVFMKQSQVRIMGANAATENLEKTDVLIDLVPLGDKFDNTTAFLTFQRFWQKQVVIKSSFFGYYEVLSVSYPGLPPSPPSAESTITIIDGVPYINSGNNARTMHPLGVDVGKKNGRGLSGSIIAIIVLSSFAVLVICIGTAWLLVVKCGNHTEVVARTPKQSAGAGAGSTMFGSGISSASLSFGSNITAYTGTAKTFSAYGIEIATDNFSESRILGEGGFGVVYKGILDDGKEVAVKVLKRDDQQGGREFLAEVEMLSRLHHRNLVKLIGICIEDHSHSLVYELIPNGSVESHLHGVDKETSPLDWGSRMKIALGSARGLAYLHEDSSPHVIHRDFKSSNILLEDDFTPKVSDFGLARSALEEGSNHISTRVMGTFGYVAPEYAMTGHLLVKSDVYSYGVVLLELLTGRKPVDMSQPEGQENLVAWARPLLTSKEGLEMIIDPALGSNYTFDNVAKVAAIASMCVQPEVTHRPFMGEVVQALKLVCDETKEVGESEEHSSIVDIDTKASGSGRLLGDAHGPYSDYDSSPEDDRGLSASDIFSTSRFGRHHFSSGSFRRHSSSGPLRPGRSRQFWKRVKGVSRGSVSEHGFAYRLWGES